MKTRLFFFVLLGLIIPVSVVCQPSADVFSVVGNVKNCKNVIKYYSGDEIWNSVSISRSGLEKEYHFSDGSTKSQTIVQNAGRKQKNSIHKDASGKTELYYTETWDSLDGKIVKETRTRTSVNSVENKESTICVIYEFDTTENKTYITTYDNGIPCQQLVETRDFSGLLIKDVWYFWGWVNQLPKKKGFLMGSKDNISSSISYIYDAKGKLIQTIEYRYCIEGVHERVVTYYDKNGRETKICTYDPDDYINCEIKFSYDSKGMVTQKAFKYFNDGETTTLVEKFVLKYDKQGNWISRKTFRDGKLEAELTREIEYWD